MKNAFKPTRHGTQSRLFPLAVLTLMGALISGPASASLFMEVSAISESGSGSDQMLIDAPGTLLLHGNASGAAAHVEPGDNPCLPNLSNCGDITVNPRSFAYAEMDAGSGHFQLYAGEIGGGGGSAGMFMTDALSHTGQGPVGVLNFDIHIDLSLYANVSSSGAQAYSDFNFSILGLTCDSGICDYTQELFNFTATRQSDDTGNYSSYGWTDINGGGDSGSDIPGVFETTFSQPIAAGAPFEFAIAISGGGGCDFGFDCGTAHADSRNSAYLGIRGDFTSVNGYTYTGYAAAVPVPAAEWLLGSGLLGLLGVIRRRG